ncbi:hypothetical protein M409DRAFT_30098 [Zasmidium cellare ATCC 36951]|uniref:Uncharacterized protein n=1 Tax=Zasmidium cellare ATCC 36951 TaxID=1080233 RepID=A0A6A6BXF6_ZASCE|nr:uncharacterized protein M409DRAFT_30098 [Zasmidium cellare ATCC 36951]KAF2159477.1 hypothetical protein M409DRAFT_30098 [Zasmidium cellare ATCC 36951]
MVSAKLEVLHNRRKGTARIEYAMFEPFWRFRDPTGEPILTIRLLDVLYIKVSVLQSERIKLVIRTKKRPYLFISTKSKKFHAPFSRVFPPIEYLRGLLCDEPAAKKQPLSLFDLPQELLDVIFGLAYPAQEGLVINGRDGWQSEQKQQNRCNGTATALRKLVPKVCDFMVSKRFLKESAKAWSIKLAASFIWRVATFPSLKELNLMVSEPAFESVEPQYPWKATLGEKEFRIIFEKFGLGRLRGLKKFSLVAGEIYRKRTKLEKQKWEENVAALETYQLPFVTKPRISTVTNAKSGSARGVSLTDEDAAEVGDSPVPGVYIAKGGLILFPSSMQLENLKTTQAFITQNSNAVISAIWKNQVNEDLATEFAALKI